MLIKKIKKSKWFSATLRFLDWGFVITFSNVLHCYLCTVAFLDLIPRVARESHLTSIQQLHFLCCFSPSIDNQDFYCLFILCWHKSSFTLVFQLALANQVESDFQICIFNVYFSRYFSCFDL